MDITTKIFDLFDYVDEHSLEADEILKGHLDYVNEQWDKLPDEKNEDTERTLLAHPMIDLSLKIKDFQLAKKWIDIYLFDEEHQEQVEFLFGKLEFEKGNLRKAFDHFKKAFELTNGRMLEGKGKYLDFYLSPEKYMTK